MISEYLISNLGSNYGYHVCDCHFTEEGCANEGIVHNACNCDAFLPIPTSDSGNVKLSLNISYNTVKNHPCGICGSFYKKYLLLKYV